MNQLVVQGTNPKTLWTHNEALKETQNQCLVKKIQTNWWYWFTESNILTLFDLASAEGGIGSRVLLLYGCPNNWSSEFASSTSQAPHTSPKVTPSDLKNNHDFEKY